MIRRAGLVIAACVLGCGPAAPTHAPIARPKPADDRPSPYASSVSSSTETSADGTLSTAEMRTYTTGVLTFVAPKTRAFVPTSIPTPDALAFFTTPGRRGVFVALRTTFGSGRSSANVASTIAAYDIDGQAVLWRRLRRGDVRALLPSPDGASVVVSDAASIELLDAATGASRGTSPIPTRGRPVATKQGLLVHDGEQATLLSWADLSKRCTIELPTVESPSPGLAVVAGDTRAAITTHHRVGDKSGSYVAAVDLVGCHVDRLLPGWIDAVAGGSLFTLVRRDEKTDVAPVPSQVASSTTDHHLARTDLVTLETAVMPLPGAEHPRHAWAPDGRRALFWWTHSQPQLPLRVLDVATGTFTPVKESSKDSLVYGSSSDHPVAMTADGSRAYVITPRAQLARIDLATATIAYGATAATDLEKVPARRPRVAVSPATGEVLVIGARDDDAIEVHDPVSLATIATIGP